MTITQEGLVSTEVRKTFNNFNWKHRMGYIRSQSEIDIKGFPRQVKSTKGCLCIITELGIYRKASGGTIHYSEGLMTDTGDSNTRMED